MSSIRRLWVRVWWLLSALVLTGCAATNLLSEAPVIGTGSVAIKIPADIVVTAIDGNPVNSPSVFRTEYQVRVSEGQHSVELVYARNWADSSEYLEQVRWNPVSLSTAFSADRRYRVDYQKPQSYQQALELKEKAPIWIAEDATAQNAGAIQTAVEPAVLAQVEHIPEAVEPISCDCAGPAGPAAPSAHEDKLRAIKALWKQLNPEQRKAFWMHIAPN